MSETNHTPNIGLSQFVSSDKLTRTDYNADMLKVDAHPKSYLFLSLAGHQISSGDTSPVAFPTATIEYGGSATSSELYLLSPYALGITVPTGYSSAVASAYINFPVAVGYIRYLFIYRKRSLTDLLVGKSSMAPVAGCSIPLSVSFSGPVQSGDKLYIVGFQDSGSPVTFSSAGLIQMSITLS